MLFNPSIFNNQIFNTGNGAPEETPGDSPTRHSYDLYLEKERKLQAKQEEIIALRLEAQENLLRKREFEASKEKQNTRQIAALNRREAEIQTELLALLNQLSELSVQSKQRQNEEALLVLSMAYPFISLGVH